MRIPLQIGLIALVAACGSHVESGALAPAARLCVGVARVPQGLRDGRAAADRARLGRPAAAGADVAVDELPSQRHRGATSYDSGYNFAIRLSDQRVLGIYERRGSRPVKEGARPPIQTGERDVNGVKWSLTTLAGGATTLDATSGGVYTELSVTGGSVDTLVEIAGTLRPSRPSPARAHATSAPRFRSGPILMSSKQRSQAVLAQS